MKVSKYFLNVCMSRFETTKSFRDEMTSLALAYSQDNTKDYENITWKCGD